MEKEYIKWVNNAGFASTANGLCWIDIAYEIDKLCKNYKIISIMNNEEQLKDLSESLKRRLSIDEDATIEIDEFFGNKGTKEILSSYLQNMYEIQSTLNNKLTDLYIDLYLERKHDDTRLFQDKKYTTMVYKYEYRSVGFRALYFFDNAAWKRYSENDFFDIYQRCILNDFGTDKRVKELMKKYSDEKSDILNKISNDVKQLIQSIPKQIETADFVEDYTIEP